MKTNSLLKKIASFFLIFLFLCSFFKKPALAQSFGFNVHSLSNESEENIKALLEYLAQNCETTIVRLWGYNGTLGVNGQNLYKVLRSAPSNIQFIVALEDFPFGPAQANPTAWYQQAAQPGSSYYQHVQAMLSRFGNEPQILAWELLNEPHCKGDHGSCFNSFKSFARSISNLIATYTSAYISPGLMGGHLSWDEYEEISNLPNITANSCHYNSNTNNPDTCLTALSRKGDVDYFYVGEAGYRGGADCSGGGCTNRDCTNCCDTDTLQQRADEVFSHRDTLLDAEADAFLVWQFSPRQNGTLICDEFSVFPKDPICSGTGDLFLTPSELETPPNRQTEFGRAVYGRNIPCGPITLDQGPWMPGDPNQNQHPETYFDPYNIEDPLNSAISGYPFDYSPWRPYPGDSGRLFYELNFNDQGEMIGTTPIRNENYECYDLTELPITTYCNPAPIVTDVAQWFPKEEINGQNVEGDEQRRTIHLLGLFRAWWTDYPGSRHASQIPFLGNSLTSSREFTGFTQRASLFVTDFLRGSVMWDRKPLRNKRRWVDESGPIRKLYPDERFNNWDFRNAFINVRLFNQEGEDRGSLLHPNPIRDKNKVLDDRIHDYVVVYSGGGHIIKESEFNSLPDRRYSVYAEGTGNFPYRLSAFRCLVDQYWGMCPYGGGDIGNEAPGWLRMEENISRFPITTREDVPAFVDTWFEGVWDESVMNGPPPGRELGLNPTIEEIYSTIEPYQRLASPPEAPPVYEWHDDAGVYHVNTGRFSSLPPDYLPIYEFHFVDLVFIPHIAESYELGAWAGLILTPYQLDWEDDPNLERLSLGGRCNINEFVRGGPGDTLGGDFHHQLADNDGNGVPWAPNEGERLLRFITEGEAIAGPGDWACNNDPAANDYPFPARATSLLTTTGRIRTQIPYLEQVAKRLIGRAGVFTSLLPWNFREDVYRAIDQVTDGEVYPWELPGYGPAHFSYANGLEREDAQSHWGSWKGNRILCDKQCDAPFGVACTGPNGLYPCPDRCGCKSKDGSCYEWCTTGECEKIEAPGEVGPDCHPICKLVPCTCFTPAGDVCNSSPNRSSCGPVLITSEHDELPFTTDLRGWGEVNEEDARFYYPYVGAIDIFRQYLLNGVNPHALANFGVGIGASTGYTPPPGGTPLPPADSCSDMYDADCVDPGDCLGDMCNVTSNCPDGQVCCANDDQVVPLCSSTPDQQRGCMFSSPTKDAFCNNPDRHCPPQGFIAQPSCQAPNQWSNCTEGRRCCDLDLKNRYYEMYCQ